jgi:hypothetical protein
MFCSISLKERHIQILKLLSRFGAEKPAQVFYIIKIQAFVFLAFGLFL